MRRRILRQLTALTLIAQPLAFADEPSVTADYYYDEDDDEEFFPEGTSVGTASDEGIRAARRARYRNWGLAIGVVVVGITTLVLVAKNR